MLDFSEWFKERLKENKLSRLNASFELGYSADTINKWATGQRSPVLDNAQDVADKFGYEIIIVKKQGESNEI